jgi:hypothetical protein
MHPGRKHDRNVAMKTAHESGSTYADIGRRYGVSISRAIQVVKHEYKRAQLPPICNLSVRSENAVRSWLRHNGDHHDGDLTIETIGAFLDAVKAGYQQHNCGKKSLRELQYAIDKKSLRAAA